VGAFLPPMLYHCAEPDRAARVHDTEAFGPVATVMGYSGLDHAAHLANRGGGSLVPRS
jgi:oxepin-CoA hydrolase/3-oxo-5,6-dehydrosuberyl-CoA semialdehyde dehydrogenase